MSFYEKHYGKLVAVIGVAVLCGVVFVGGYAKGSSKSAKVIAREWQTRVTGILHEAWTQTADPLPEHFLQPSRKPGTGVTINKLEPAEDLVLLTGFFDENPGLKLVQRDGTVLAEWPAVFSELLPERLGKPTAPQTDWNVDLHGSYIEPDGSIVFNFEYQGTVKLSRCGKRLWALPQLNHHSIEPAGDGGFWIGGRHVELFSNPAAYRPLAAPNRTEGWVEDDLIMHVSGDGDVLETKSVYGILVENGLEPVLTATGTLMGPKSFADNELLHLNMISELSADYAKYFPMFAAGDLVISVREYNLVFVVDPHDWKVKWHSTGPWVRQHSAQFFSDGTITVFNNNAYVYQSGPDGVTDLTQPRDSQVLSVDPATGQSRLRYGSAPGQEMFSVVRGYIQERPDGGVLITEPDAGRAFQVDASGNIVWEYINRYDADHVLEMTGARAYPAAYFNVTDWSCP